MQLKQLLNRILGEPSQADNGSVHISDPAIIKNFVSNPDNPFLVSFPRTGSHWLRLMMELYFGRPSLVRIFYYHDRSNYLTLHTHDMDLTVERKNVIYLYREPVETIFSQMTYCKESLDDKERINHWAESYKRHLNKWLVEENFTTKKTILTYEGMKKSLAAEFGKITDHFGESLNEARLNEIAGQVTKDEVKRKTGHDRQVIQRNKDYDTLRNTFRVKNSQLIWNTILGTSDHLKRFFNGRH